jgi:hypothetical protein
VQALFNRLLASSHGTEWSVNQRGTQVKHVISGLFALRRLATGLVLVALLGAVLAVPANIAAAAGGPVVTSLDPGSGPVGTPVKLIGSGFVPGDTVQFQGVGAAPARVNAAGTRITTTVPLFALSGPINVIDPTGLEAESPQPFTVTEGVIARPAEQVPGHTVTFEGSALAPNSSVTLTWNGTPLEQADTNGSGGFSIQYHISGNQPPGPYYVGVEGYEFAPIVFLVLSTWPQFGDNHDHTGLDGFEPFLTESHVAAGLTYKFGIYPELGFPAAIVNASPVVVGTGRSSWNQLL